MADGLCPTLLANKWLNWLSGTAETAPAANYIELHTASPGVAGTTAVSSVTTRVAATSSAASAGVLTMSNSPAWTSWAGTNGEIVTDIAVWDTITGGNFLYSVALTSSKTVNTGDTLTLTSLTVTLSPLAA